MPRFKLLDVVTLGLGKEGTWRSDSDSDADSDADADSDTDSDADSDVDWTVWLGFSVESSQAKTFQESVTRVIEDTKNNAQDYCVPGSGQIGRNRRHNGEQSRQRSKFPRVKGESQMAILGKGSEGSESYVAKKPKPGEAGHSHQMSDATIYTVLGEALGDLLSLRAIGWNFAADQAEGRDPFA